MSYAQGSSGASHELNEDAKAATAAARKGLKSLTDAVHVIPGLGALGYAALKLFDLKEEVQSNKDESDALIDRVTKITKDILEPTRGLLTSSLDEALTKDVNELEQAVILIRDFIENLIKLPLALQIARSPAIKAEIQKHHSRLDAALSRFDTVSLWSLRVSTIRLAQEANFTAQRAGTGASLISTDLPMSRLPPKPGVFLGRDELVDSVTAILTSHTSPHIAILGAGGMGKTALALSVLHDTRTERKFGRHRLFISCDGTTSAAGIISILAAALQLGGQTDIRQAINQYFQRLQCPVLLILDNLETAWDSPDRLQVEEFLADVSNLQYLALIITMRGGQRPDGPEWTQPFLEELGPLNLLAARQLYLKICGEDVEEKGLDELLQSLDCWPLAVRLMAALGQIGSSPSLLLRRYEQEKTAMLKRGQEHRLTCLDISIQLSLESQTVQQDPHAIELLSLLSMLPDGVALGQLSSLFPTMTSCHQAAATLQLASLLIKTKNDMISVLSPIRIYMASHYHLEGIHWREMRGYFVGVAARGTEIGSSSTKDAVAALTPYFHNIQSVLLHAVSTDWDDQMELIGQATLYLSYFSNFTRFGNVDNLLQAALLKAQSTETKSFRWQAPLGCALGLSLFLQNKYTEAAPVLEESRERYMVAGSCLGTAHCTQILADIFRMQEHHEEAVPLLKQAQQMFEEAGYVLGSARCKQSLGNILRMQNHCEEAAVLLEQAREEFEQSGDRPGVAACTMSLGDILLVQCHYKKAAATQILARDMFEEIADLRGAAECISSLSDIFYMEEHYEEASTTAKRAKKMFEEIGDQLGAGQCTVALGHICHSQKHYEDATAHFEQAKRMFEKIGERAGVARCLLGLGGVLAKQNRLEEARATLNLAKELFEGMGIQLGAANCIESLGKLLWKQSHYKEAAVTLEQAKTIYEKIGSQAGAADCTHILGRILLAQHYHEEAAATLTQAKGMFEAFGFCLGAARCIHSLGTNLHVQNRYTEAAPILVQAKEKFEELGSPFDLALCLQTLGSNFLQQHHYDEATSSLTKAKGVYEESKDYHGVAQCFESLGQILYMQSRPYEAAANLQQAKDMFKEIGESSGAAWSTMMLGDILCRQDHYDKATALLNEAKEMSEESGNHVGAAWTIRTLGDILLRQNRYDAAAAMLNVAKEMSEEIGDRIGTAWCIRLLGEVLFRQNLYREASAAFQQAREMSEQIPDHYGVAQCIRSLGNILSELKQYSEAETMLKQAREMSNEIRDRLGAVQCTQSLGSLLYIQNHNAEAAALLEQSKDAFEEMGVWLGAAQCKDLLNVIQTHNTGTELQTSQGVVNWWTVVKMFVKGVFCS